MEKTSANFEQLDFFNDIDDQYLMNVLEQPVINTKPRPQNFFTNCSVTINYNFTRIDLHIKCVLIANCCVTKLLKNVRNKLLIVLFGFTFVVFSI